MRNSVANFAAEGESQIDENEAVSESSAKPKRKPENWKEGWTEIENRIFTQGRFLSSDAKVIYSTLKSFRNRETHLCYPAYDKIMERSGMSKPRVADALAELKKFSWLSAKERFGNSPLYTFHIPVVYELDADKNRIGLFADQTCPRKEQAKEWAKRLRVKRSNGKSWSDTIKAENKKFEKGQMEKIGVCSCGLDSCMECQIPF